MNEEQIKEVRQANDIVEVISSYLPLIKKGKNYFGVCPFHDDTNPSMSVSFDKQIYKCFSCGASGNVINFVMDYEHLGFRDALNILAKKAGITIKGMSIRSTNKYDKYYKMYDLATKLYQNNLNSKEGIAAKAYLLSRGISDDLIKQFKIGLSLKDKDNLSKVLNGKDYTNKELEQYGLGNGSNDLFINRIMFPLPDVANNVVGFSGRIFNTQSDSKYINTRETPIFKKGELLYNYYLAKEEIRLVKKLIITEGFMDVIRLHSKGIKNAIALMGTAITKEQITLIKRLSTNIYLSLDGDGPGRKAMYTIGEELEKSGLKVNVVVIPDGMDPDDFIMKQGIASYESLYNNAIPLSEYKINFLKEGKNLSSIEDQTDYINKVLIEINNEKDEIKRELMLKRINKEFNVDIEILRKKLQNMQKYSKIDNVKKSDIPNRKTDKYDKATYTILYYMLNSYEATKIFERKLNYFPNTTARYLANEIIYYYKKNGTLELADFITVVNEKEELKSYLNEVLRHTSDEEIDLLIFNDYLAVIMSYNKVAAIKRLKSLMEKEPDPVKKSKIAEEIRQVKIGE